MIALIDGDSIAYIAGADKVGEEPKTEEIAKEQIHSIINEITKQTGALGYLVFLTKGRQSFRYNIDVNYKKNREGFVPPPLMYFSKDYMRTLEGVYDCTEVEADDAVNIMQHYYKSKGVHSIICSPDKDVLSLEGEHFNYRKMEFVTTSLAESSYKFWTSMITGDSTDGIKGIPSKGKAFADKLFSTNTGIPYSQLVLHAYINHFSEENGVEEFYKNYKLLKVIKEYPGFNCDDYKPKFFNVEELF